MNGGRGALAQPVDDFVCGFLPGGGGELVREVEDGESAHLTGSHFYVFVSGHALNLKAGVPRSHVPESNFSGFLCGSVVTEAEA